MYLTPVVSQSYLQPQTLIERSVRFVEWNVLRVFISVDLSPLSVCVEFGFVVRSGARLKLWNLHRFVRQRTCAPAGTSWCVQVHLNCDTRCVVYLVGWLITQYSAVLWTLVRGTFDKCCNLCLYEELQLHVHPSVFRELQFSLHANLLLCSEAGDEWTVSVQSGFCIFVDEVSRQGFLEKKPDTQTETDVSASGRQAIYRRPWCRWLSVRSVQKQQHAFILVNLVKWS